MCICLTWCHSDSWSTPLSDIGRFLSCLSWSKIPILESESARLLLWNRCCLFRMGCAGMLLWRPRNILCFFGTWLIMSPVQVCGWIVVMLKSVDCMCCCFLWLVSRSGDDSIRVCIQLWMQRSCSDQPSTNSAIKNLGRLTSFFNLCFCSNAFLISELVSDAKSLTNEFRCYNLVTTPDDLRSAIRKSYLYLCLPFFLKSVICIFFCRQCPRDCSRERQQRWKDEKCARGVVVLLRNHNTDAKLLTSTHIAWHKNTIRMVK